jgi:hypothetical protein
VVFFVVKEILVIGFQHAKIGVILGRNPGVFAKEHPALIFLRKMRAIAGCLPGSAMMAPNSVTYWEAHP